MDPRTTFDLQEAAAILARTPEVLGLLLAGLGPTWVAGDDDPEDWSPYAVVGHLCHGEVTDWIPRTRIILEHGTAMPFEPFDRVAMFAARDETMAQRLQRFAALRRDNLAALHEMSLTPEDLQRRGMHPELGEITLRQMLATWALHDLSHIAQIATALARRYTDEVGPWTRFFPELQP